MSREYEKTLAPGEAPPGRSERARQITLVSPSSSSAAIRAVTVDVDETLPSGTSSPSGVNGVVKESLDIFAAILDEVVAVGGTRSQMRILQTDRGRLRAVAELIVTGRVAPGPKSRIYPARVDYRFPDMAELRQRYGRSVNFAFRNPIPFSALGESQNARKTPDILEFEYICLGQGADTADAFGLIVDSGYRAALPEELLSFDLEYPKEKERYPIAALGAVTSVTRKTCVVSLERMGIGLGVDLRPISDRWAENQRFLAVRLKK